MLAVVLNGLSQAGPDSGAAALVPADALAFVNVSTDAGRPEVKQALALAKAFPAYAGVRARRSSEGSARS